MIRRSEVIQSFVNLFDKPKYLEVGVSKGVTFHELKAHEKVAVDPFFDFPVGERETGNADYHEVTSDEYFGRIANVGTYFDVIFLDGLHTFEQTLRDLLNAINFSHDQTVIIIDDVEPPTALAAIADRAVFKKVRSFTKQESKKTWMGDVYKLVFFVNAYLQQYTLHTIRDNHGQAVLWRAPRATVNEMPVEKIARMSFDEFVMNVESLNSKPLSHIVDLYKHERN